MRQTRFTLLTVSVLTLALASFVAAQMMDTNGPNSHSQATDTSSTQSMMPHGSMMNSNHMPGSQQMMNSDHMPGMMNNGSSQAGNESQQTSSN